MFGMATITLGIGPHSSCIFFLYILTLLILYWFVQNRGMRVNMNKTKVMISTERQKPLQKAVRWPCGVCGRGVGSNSIQCTSCHKWVHKKCSGIKGSMYKVMGVIHL